MDVERENYTDVDPPSARVPRLVTAVICGTLGAALPAYGHRLGVGDGADYVCAAFIAAAGIILVARAATSP